VALVISRAVGAFARFITEQIRDAKELEKVHRTPC
jgi:hypothetical protein